jgi:hypothetical protein
MGGNNLPIRLEGADPLGDEASQLLRQIRAEAPSRYGDALDASAPASNEPLVARSAFLLALRGARWGVPPCTRLVRMLQKSSTCMYYRRSGAVRCTPPTGGVGGSGGRIRLHGSSARDWQSLA